MKKKLFFFFPLFLLFILVSCDVSYKTVTEKGLSFEIPDNWDFDKGETATLYGNFNEFLFNSAVKIRMEEGAESGTSTSTDLMNSGMDDFYKLASEGYNMLESNIKKEVIDIDGVAATKITFEIHPPETLIISAPSGDIYKTNESNTAKYSYAQVFFTKGNLYYNISIYTEITSLEGLQISDKFLESLKFI